MGFRELETAPFNVAGCKVYTPPSVIKGVMGYTRGVISITPAITPGCKQGVMVGCKQGVINCVNVLSG